MLSPNPLVPPCAALLELVFLTHYTGFVFFVASLQAGNYKFQFTQFAWTHMALYLIVVEAHFIMNNIFEGLIWFFLPAALVITNDIWAYICGITFGRTQLIKLSPKKTVEGFIGAWVMTIFFGIILTSLLLRSSYFICPVTVSRTRMRLSPCLPTASPLTSRNSIEPWCQHLHRPRVHA